MSGPRVVYPESPHWPGHRVWLNGEELVDCCVAAFAGDSGWAIVQVEAETEGGAFRMPAVVNIRLPKPWVRFPRIKHGTDGMLLQMLHGDVRIECIGEHACSGATA